MISRFRILALALAALTVVACGGGDSEDIARPDQLRLTIVSGDRQTAPVRPPATASASAALVPAANLPPNLLPEPLVARIVVDGASPSTSPLGPSFAVLPADLVVTFRVVQPQDQLGRDCGESFIDSAKPDADGLVTTYWERGTIAGVECRMEVRLVVDGQPRVDTAFVATFEPGPAVFVNVPPNPSVMVQTGDTVDIRPYILSGRDQYGNELTAAQVTALPDSLVEWAWRDRVGGSPYYDTPIATGTGWLAEVPHFDGFLPSHDGNLAPGLQVWVNGYGFQLVFKAPAPST